MSHKPYNRPLEHKDYLRLKYLSTNDDKKSHQKKTKKKVVKNSKKIRIFDDDIDLKDIEANDSDEEIYYGTKEEKPIIAEVIDERPLHMRRKDIDTNRWKAIDSNAEDMEKSEKQNVLIEIHKKKSKRVSDKDSFGHKRSKSITSNTTTRADTNRSDSDLSPQRTDATNGRSKRRGRDEDSDLSPERETNDKRRRHDSDSDLSPPRTLTSEKMSNKRQETTLSGKKSGLSDGKHLREELMAAKKREEKLFNSISDEMLGKNAKTVFRDRKTGRVRDIEEEAKLQYEKDLIKDKMDSQKKAKYDKWSKGVVQTQERNDKLKSDLHEMSKPLARYEGDVDLDKMLREKEREDDPMLATIRKNKVKEQIKEGVYKERPLYKGPTPSLNRFNISPGYRWDGVDRSNGFEKRYFDRIANKESTLEEAYRWSTQDM